jgi:hypothetical protein
MPHLEFIQIVQCPCDHTWKNEFMIHDSYEEALLMEGWPPVIEGSCEYIE